MGWFFSSSASSKKQSTEIIRADHVREGDIIRKIKIHSYDDDDIYRNFCEVQFTQVQGTAHTRIGYKPRGSFDTQYERCLNEEKFERLI